MNVSTEKRDTLIILLICNISCNIASFSSSAAATAAAVTAVIYGTSTFCLLKVCVFLALLGIAAVVCPFGGISFYLFVVHSLPPSYLPSVLQ